MAGTLSVYSDSFIDTFRNARDSPRRSTNVMNWSKRPAALLVTFALITANALSG